MGEAILDIIRQGDKLPDVALFLLLTAGAFLEYVFPPFPGDLSTALGAALLARRESGWAAIIGFLGVTLGAMLGFMVDYYFGRWLADPRRRFRHWGPSWERLGRGIDRVAVLFQRHTPFYLMVNRFLPGVRALFFVAAGFARVPVWKVLLFGGLSAALWNAALMTAGSFLGRNAEKVLAEYSFWAWGVLLATAAVILARFLWKRKRSRRPAHAGPGCRSPGP